MLPNSFNHPLIVFSMQFLNKRKMHIKRSQSVIICHSFNILISKQSSVFSACRARGRVCLKRLVILQNTWITYSPWTRHRSSWKPRVSVIQGQNESTIQKKKRNKAASDGAISFYLDHTRISKSHIWRHLQYSLRPKSPRSQITVSQGVHRC